MAGLDDLFSGGLPEQPHHRDRCASAQAELGVYLLGAIEPSDRDVAEQHLAGCPRCREVLAALAGLPALLRRVPDGQRILEADPAVRQTPAIWPEALLRRKATLRRRNRALAAAAVVALIAGTAAVSTAAHREPQSQPSAPSAWRATVQAINPGSHMWALVRYTPRRWGTGIEARISGVPAGTRCQLWVTDADGQHVPAGSWTVATSRPALWYPASASLRAASLRSFVITTSQGMTLVIIPAQSRPGSAVRR